MQINAEKWAQIRAAAELDDQRGFEAMVIEFARIAVAHERSHAVRCDAVRAIERGQKRYFCFDR